MSFAVQTDHGLMAPVVQNVNLKGLEQIATEVREIAGRARDNKLKPAELSGGTFTVSNLGMFGVSNSQLLSIHHRPVSSQSVVPSKP